LNLISSQSLSQEDSKGLFEIIQELIKHDMSEDDLTYAYFALGKLCSNLKKFKESFEYHHSGNRLKRRQIEFNIGSHVDYLSRIKEIFSAAFIECRKSWGSNSEIPIFIFGMPRSGTTLVEQILASHPNVYGAGELLFLPQIDKNLASVLKVNAHYPECLNFLDEQTAHAIADLYSKSTKETAGSSKDYMRITDKNPFNYYHLGLISLLFPKASFIHCKRHPLDTCLSTFRNLQAGLISPTI